MKILVGGLLPKQERFLRQACPAGVELRFVSIDNDPSVWASRGKDCDYCILLTKFVSHRHREKWKAAGCNVIDFSGGISGLKELLLTLSQRSRP